MLKQNYPCLVLNYDYRKLRIITYKKAFRLLFSNKAEILSTYKDKIYTVRKGFPIPAVIRLMKRLSLKFNVRLTRKNIFIRDGFLCQYCGKKFPSSKLTIDHVLPRSRGGKFKWENIVTCCFACNVKKSNRTPEEAGMSLKKLPVKLEYWCFANQYIGNMEFITEWADYL